MNESAKANTTALPLDERPDVHHEGPDRVAPISLEQDKDLLDGRLPADRFDDERMRDGAGHDEHAAERERTERGNRGPGEEPGFGQGA